MSFTSWLRNLKSAWRLPRSGGNRRLQPGFRQPQWSRPSLEALEDRTLLDAALAAAVDSRLATLENGLTGLVHTAAALPILNQSIDSVAKKVANSTDPTNPGAFDTFRLVLNTALTSLKSNASDTQIHDALYSTLSVNQLLFAQNVVAVKGPLHVPDGVTETVQNDVQVTRDATTGDIHITLNVGASVAIARGFTFGLGLPVIPLSVNSGGALQVSAGFGYRNLSFTLHNGAPSSIRVPLPAPSRSP